MHHRTRIARVATADLSTLQVLLAALAHAVLTFAILSVALALQAL